MWFLLLLLLTSVHTKKNDGLEKKLQRTRTSLWSSLNKFKDDVISFFKIDTTKIEQKRKTVRKALCKFVDNVIAANDSKNSAICLKRAKKTVEISDSDVSFEEIVNSHGYKAETHTIVTADGYLLLVHRILPAISNDSAYKSGIVLMHHGLLGSSEDWILLGPKKALPYVLVNAHYDVWLANARGNKYSKGHTNPFITDDEFWNFSWHEIGQFDLSAVIDYVRSQNDKNLLFHYIGHSMGCTALFTLLSTYPRYNYVLRTAILLAPLAFMYNVKGPLRVLAEFYKQNTLLSLILLGKHDFGPLKHFPKTLSDKFCYGSKITCSNPLLLLANGGLEISNTTLRQSILRHVPAGGSVKTLIHYIQLVTSGQFQMYDMGTSKNFKLYGRIAPPAYRLNDVTLPVAIFSSSDDLLSTISDIQSLMSNFPNPVIHHIIGRDEFSHTDFVWAEDADVLVYYLILDVIRQISL